jgi:hypothetical protein
MDIFKIEIITNKSFKIEKLFYCKGKIVIGNYEDTFYSALGSWALPDYRLQWKEGLERFRTHDTSCLVISAQDLQNIPIIERWELHKENDIAYFNQQIIVPPMAPIIGFPFPLSEFNRTNCYACIPPRKVNEKGEAIDDHNNLLVEWPVSYKAVEEFAKSLEP